MRRWKSFPTPSLPLRLSSKMLSCSNAVSQSNIGCGSSNKQLMKSMTFWTIVQLKLFDWSSSVHLGPRGEESAELVAIGKEIVNKCGGVPLAAKTLGSLMRFKATEQEWQKVKESEIWDLTQEENSILPALRSSYVNLPVELRQCFAYCSLFPRDSVMIKERVIQQWMANGFTWSYENLDLEDIGDKIWRKLHWRSFFEVIVCAFIFPTDTSVFVSCG